MIEKTREQGAIHEAGRAIVACALGISFERASVSPDLPGVAPALSDLEAATVEQLEQALLVGLAGAAAESMRTTHGPLAVEMLAEDYGGLLACVDALSRQRRDARPGARDLLLLSLWERTLKLLNTHWGSVALLSDLLLELGAVNWIEVNELFEHTTKWRVHSE